jgi:hypothetical protein
MPFLFRGPDSRTVMHPLIRNALSADKQEVPLGLLLARHFIPNPNSFAKVAPIDCNREILTHRGFVGLNHRRIDEHPGIIGLLR